MSAIRYPFQMVGVVPRVFTVTGLDRLIPCFAALEQALAQVPPAPGRAPRLGLPQRDHARFFSAGSRRSSSGER